MLLPPSSPVRPGLPLPSRFPGILTELLQFVSLGPIQVARPTLPSSRPVTSLSVAAYAEWSRSSRVTPRRTHRIDREPCALRAELAGANSKGACFSDLQESSHRGPAIERNFWSHGTSDRPLALERGTDFRKVGSALTPLGHCNYRLNWSR